MYMKYMLGQYWVAHTYGDNKFVKIWLEENKASRDAESADRTKAFRALLKKSRMVRPRLQRLKPGSCVECSPHDTH